MGMRRIRFDQLAKYLAAKLLVRSVGLGRKRLCQAKPESNPDQKQSVFHSGDFLATINLFPRTARSQTKAPAPRQMNQPLAGSGTSARKTGVAKQIDSQAISTLAVPPGVIIYIRLRLSATYINPSLAQRISSGSPDPLTNGLTTPPVVIFKMELLVPVLETKSVPPASKVIP